MHDFHHFPEASEREVMVHGIMLPASVASVVRTGWVVGMLYALLLLGTLVSSVLQGASAATGAFGMLELALVAALVAGVYRWQFLPALALCLHPVVSIAFYGAGGDGLPLLAGEFGPAQGAATLIVVALVGRSAKVIRAFRSATSDAA
jgi:hypothetical protein